MVLDNPLTGAKVKAQVKVKIFSAGEEGSQQETGGQRPDPRGRAKGRRLSQNQDWVAAKTSLKSWSKAG